CAFIKSLQVKTALIVIRRDATCCNINLADNIVAHP
ncbi:MAG: hypothetical protein ACI9SK_001649, partial [Zhongshania sp.]